MWCKWTILVDAILYSRSRLLSHVCTQFWQYVDKCDPFINQGNYQGWLWVAGESCYSYSTRALCPATHTQPGPTLRPATHTQPGPTLRPATHTQPGLSVLLLILNQGSLSCYSYSTRADSPSCYSYSTRALRPATHTQPGLSVLLLILNQGRLSVLLLILNQGWLSVLLLILNQGRLSVLLLILSQGSVLLLILNQGSLSCYSYSTRALCPATRTQPGLTLRPATRTQSIYHWSASEYLLIILVFYLIDFRENINKTFSFQIVLSII